MPMQICDECRGGFEARDYFLVLGGGRRYCSGACRQRGFQRRQTARIIEMARRDLLAQLGIDDPKERR